MARFDVAVAVVMDLMVILTAVAATRVAMSASDWISGGLENRWAIASVRAIVDVGMVGTVFITTMFELLYRARASIRKLKEE